MQPVIVTSIQLVKVNVPLTRGKKGKTKVATAITTFVKPVPLVAPRYDGATHTLTLLPTGKINLAQPQQLRITASLLTGADGRQLDGNRDGQPGATSPPH
jgi:hypothetical protein